MSIFGLFGQLRAALKRNDELKVVEKAKIAELHRAIETGECHDLDAATLCLESITLNLKKRDTDKLKKEGAM